MTLQRLRTLDVSAASGLVRRGDTFYIVADDELGLLAVPDVGAAFTIPLLPGVLPDPHAERKAAKPDLEALCRWPGDGLLALGSGSTASRHRACLLRPVDGDMSRGTVTVLDLAPLHARLAEAFPALNLEGAAVRGDALVLLQRGNGPGNHGALVELGARGGAPLGFTDASPLPDGSLVFVAAAEASPDTYQDGLVTGAAIGRLAADGRLLWLSDVPGAGKFEGIHAEPDGDRLRVWLVTDADDRRCPASLVRATVDASTGAWLPG